MKKIHKIMCGLMYFSCIIYIRIRISFHSIHSNVEKVTVGLVTVRA